MRETHAMSDLLLEAGYSPYLEELSRFDAQIARNFTCSSKGNRSARKRQNPPIELEPGQLAVQEMFLGLKASISDSLF